MQMEIWTQGQKKRFAEICFFDDLFDKVKSSWEWFGDLKLNPEEFLVEIWSSREKHKKTFL